MFDSSKSENYGKKWCPGDGHRIGVVKERSQTNNPKTDQWVKRNANTGQFMDVKQDRNPFKGIRVSAQITFSINLASLCFPNFLFKLRIQLVVCVSLLIIL